MTPPYVRRFNLYSYYSNVATVNVSAGLVKATTADIHFDNNYLLNSSNPYFTGTTFAHLDLTPVNSTSTAQWSSSDASIASVNEKTGQITANRNGQSGSAFIGALVNNNDKYPLWTVKKIYVGAGLNEQNARVGGKATFRLLSIGNSTASKRIKVKWTRIRKNGKQEPLTNQKNPYAYTIPYVEKDNVGDKYQAKITINGKDYATNAAKLDVTVPVDPNVSLTSSIFKKSITNDTTNVLNGIESKDEIIYSMDINNFGYQNFHNSYVAFDLPLGMEVNYIVAGVDSLHLKPLDKSDYEISSDSKDLNGKSKIVRIKINDFNIDENKSIAIDTSVNDIGDGSSFSTTPYFSGLETNGDEYRSKSISPELTLNFKVQPKGEIKPNVKNIEFNPLVASQQNIIDHRTEATNDPNYVATFEDDRLQKPGVSLYLKEKTPLQGAGKLDGQLMYYRPGQTPKSIANKVLIEQSVPNQSLAPIKWSRDNGLLLNLKRCDSATGDYKTTLLWTIQNSV